MPTIDCKALADRLDDLARWVREEHVYLDSAQADSDARQAARLIRQVETLIAEAFHAGFERGRKEHWDGQD